MNYILTTDDTYEDDQHVLFSGSYLSNWYKSSFYQEMFYEEKHFNCSEQAMMYAKALLFKDYNMATHIMKTPDPKEQKYYGRQIGNFDEYVWVQCRERIMDDILFHKFSQNKNILQKLLETGNKHIVEGTTDNIWGIGRHITEAINGPKTWVGKNLLGKSLMRTRERLTNLV